MTGQTSVRCQDSPFQESDWDRRLDNMLDELGSGGLGRKQTSTSKCS